MLSIVLLGVEKDGLPGLEPTISCIVSQNETDQLVDHTEMIMAKTFKYKVSRTSFWVEQTPKSKHSWDGHFSATSDQGRAGCLLGNPNKTFPEYIMYNLE